MGYEKPSDGDDIVAKTGKSEFPVESGLRSVWAWSVYRTGPRRLAPKQKFTVDRRYISGIGTVIGSGPTQTYEEKVWPPAPVQDSWSHQVQAVAFVPELIGLFQKYEFTYDGKVSIRPRPMSNARVFDIAAEDGVDLWIWVFVLERGQRNWPYFKPEEAKLACPLRKTGIDGFTGTPPGTPADYFPD